MPTLNSDKAKSVKEADTSNPAEVIPEGFYKLQLTKVEAQKSQAGNAMWVWFFDVSGTKKKLREYTSLSEEALWKIATIFQAFDVDPSTSTDELLNKEVLAHIGVEVADRGKLKGQKVNYIVGYPDQNLEPKVFEAREEVTDDSPAPRPRTTGKKNNEVPDF